MTTELVRNTIRLLEAINPNDENAYEKAILNLNSMRFLPRITEVIEPGGIFYRSRPMDSEGLIPTINEISMPPVHCITDFARCNKPYQQMFYCSNDRPISFLELVTYWTGKKAIGDLIYVTVGRWVINIPLNTLIVTTPNPADRHSEYDKYYGAFLDAYLNLLEGESINATKEFYSYMFGKFRAPKEENSNVYIITSAYYNLCLANDEESIDAIAFPSVPSREIGANLAIRKHLITENNLTLTNVMRNTFIVHAGKTGLKDFTEIEAKECLSVNQHENSILWV
ncbi:MAG: hypothetical protein Q8M15_14575 [Bacteroidota bacterium]|nr:hypothetical protein [Bacteroidota bacterium]